MASVSSTLDRIKKDIRPFLPDSSVEAACRQAGHRWRVRKLGPVQTLHLFILQVLSFNTAMTHCVMCRAAAAQGVAPYRVSFTDAVRWLLSAGPDEALPELIVNPDRPDRHEPRAIKDRQDTYTKMSRPRKQMRKELRGQKVEA